MPYLLPEERFVMNPSGLHDDPLLGDLGELELRTVMAFEDPSARRPRIGSARDVLTVLLERTRVPGQLVVIALDNKGRVLNVLQQPAPRGADVHEALVEAETLALLSGARSVVLGVTVSEGDVVTLGADLTRAQADPGRSRHGAMLGEMLERPDNVPMLLDFVLVNTETADYASALDLGIWAFRTS